MKKLQKSPKPLPLEQSQLSEQPDTSSLLPVSLPRQEGFVNALRWTLGYWEGKWFSKCSCMLLAEWGLIPITCTT